jgi:ArsR family transcriptional regulator, arsenate/arsenite/antimonite-responsive transcriptional repressor
MALPKLFFYVRLLPMFHRAQTCFLLMTDAFRTGQSRLSFHLKVLKDAGLINDRHEGRWVYYSLNDQAVEALQDILNGLKTRSHKASKRGCCP